MFSAITPDIEAVRNSLRAHDAVHAAVFAEADIPVARGENVAVAAPISAQIPVVGHARKEIDRVVEVAIVVVVTVQKGSDIERAAHADAGGEDVGTPER